MEESSPKKGITLACSTCKHIILSQGIFFGIGRLALQCPNALCPTFETKKKQLVTIGQNFFLTVTTVAVVLFFFTRVYNKIYAKNHITCDSFTWREDAQRAFDTGLKKYRSLDKDNDGQACETLPALKFITIDL